MNKQLSLSIRFVVSVITVALMVTAAIVVGDKEVIFPETAALTVGAFVSDKLPWRTGMVRMIVVMTLGAFIGYGLSAYSPLPLYVNVIAAFTACIIILSAVRSTMLPMISAAVLPILTNVQSLVYPVSVILLTLAVIEIRLLLLRYGLIEQTEFPDENISGRAEIARRLWLIIVFAILAAAAIFSGMTFIIAPPLAVVFAEAAQKDTPVRKDPFGFFLCTILCTFAGTASRMVLCDLFRVNIVIGAAVSAAAALFFLILFKKPFPPAAALAVLPFILPESVIALYPFQVVTGCAAVISLDMIYQKALDKDIPERAVVGIIDFILSLQILPPKRVYAPADSRVKTEKNVQSDDGEILPPSLDDDNVTAIPAVSGTMTEETAVSENETRIITEKAEEEVPGIPDSIPQSDTVSEIHEETEKKADTAMMMHFHSHCRQWRKKLCRRCLNLKTMRKKLQKLRKCPQYLLRIKRTKRKQRKKSCLKSAEVFLISLNPGKRNPGRKTQAPKSRIKLRILPIKTSQTQSLLSPRRMCGGVYEILL